MKLIFGIFVCAECGHYLQRKKDGMEQQNQMNKELKEEKQHELAGVFFENMKFITLFSPKLILFVWLRHYNMLELYNGFT